MLAPPTFTTVTLNVLPPLYITGLAPAPTFSLPVANVIELPDVVTNGPANVWAVRVTNEMSFPVTGTRELIFCETLRNVKDNATPVVLCVLITSTVADRKLNPIFALVTDTLALAAVVTLRRDKLIPALVTNAVPGIVTSTERRVVDNETPVTVTDRSTTLRFHAPEFQYFYRIHW